jgi:O-antigen/teichoic acid export membrane protein
MPVSRMKSKIISASFFVILGYGFGQVIRLGSNLILTRLLIPEYFGTVAIAMVFQNGLFMLSDIGLRPGIIRSNRSQEEVFLNTAWTLQFLKSIILCFIAILLAYPISRIYQAPIIFKMLPILGISTMVEGLNSTSLDILAKELNQRKKITAQILFQIISTAITLLIAYMTRSIWSLLITPMVHSLLKTVWSHRINNFRHRFVIEKEAAQELLTFGKWIVLSTGMFYLASKADSILLGRFLGLGLFGVYNIALLFSELPKSVIEQLSNSVIFPAISQIPHNEIREKIRKPRQMILLVSAFGLALFYCLADYLILFLYDDRYIEAAWMLPLLVLGIWPRLLVMSIDRSLLTVGQPRWLAAGNVTKLIYMVIVLPLAYHIGGVLGAIIAVVLNDIPLYIVINIGLWKEKQGLMKQDLISTVALFLFIAVFVGFRLIFNGLWPGTVVL